MQDIDLKWHVLLTEPSRERVAAARLKGMGFGPYVPTFQKLTSYTVRSMFGVTRRKRLIERPLFPGYLFMPLNVAWSFGPMYDVPGLRVGERRNCSPFLKINGQFVTLSEDQMAIIREVTHRINNPEDLGLPYKVGDTVRILDGPFAERLAEISTLDDSERIMLLLELLGQKTKVFVSARHITAA